MGGVLKWSLPQAWIVIADCILLMELYQHQFIGYNRSRNTQHQCSCQIEEFHTRQGDCIVSDFFVESFDIDAPILSRDSSKNLKGLFWLVVNTCGVKRYSESSSDEIKQWDPEIKCVRKSRFVTEKKNNIFFLHKKTFHSFSLQTSKQINANKKQIIRDGYQDYFRHGCIDGQN